MTIDIERLLAELHQHYEACHEDVMLTVSSTIDAWAANNPLLLVILDRHVGTRIALEESIKRMLEWAIKAEAAKALAAMPPSSDKVN